MFSSSRLFACPFGHLDSGFGNARTRWIASMLRGNGQRGRRRTLTALSRTCQYETDVRCSMLLHGLPYPQRDILEAADKPNQSW